MDLNNAVNFGDIHLRRNKIVSARILANPLPFRIDWQFNGNQPDSDRYRIHNTSSKSVITCFVAVDERVGVGYFVIKKNFIFLKNNSKITNQIEPIFDNNLSSFNLKCKLDIFNLPNLRNALIYFRNLKERHLKYIILIF